MINFRSLTGVLLVSCSTRKIGDQLTFTFTLDKNQYVHRRDSMAVATLSETEIQQRIRLGLVTNAASDSKDEEDDDELEEWKDFDSDEDNESEAKPDDGSKRKSDEYRLANTRRSSVDLSTMISNVHDGSDAWEAGAMIRTAQAMKSQMHLEDPPSKRSRNSSLRSSSLGNIDEGDGEDDEVATVDGDDMEQGR